MCIDYGLCGFAQVVCEGFVLFRCVVIGIVIGALSEAGASSRPLFFITSETMLLRFEQILFSRYDMLE